MLEQLAAVMDMNLFLTFGAAFLGVAWLTGLGRSKNNMPPYPFTRVPVVGNMFQLLMGKQRAYEAFAEISKTKEYNKLFTIKIGSRDIVVLNHADVVREALVTKMNDFADRPSLFSGDILSDNGQDILMGKFGPVWKLQRKVAHKAIRNYASGSILERHCHQALDRMMKALEPDISKGKPFNIRPYCVLLVYNLMDGILFNKNMSFDDPEFQLMVNLTKDFLDAFGNGLPADFFPWLRHFPSPGLSKINIMLDRFLATLERNVEEHKANFNPDELRDLTDYMLMMQKEVREEDGADPYLEEALTDKRLLYSIFDMLGAAIDTLVTTMHFNIGMMTQHIDCQDKVQAEIGSVLGGQPAKLESKRFLPYTDACLCEGMRLGTLAVLGLPLATTCDTTLSGYDIPKATMVMINLFALHHDDTQWDEPEVYRPERFLNKDGLMAPKPASYLPFSGGRRVCLGEAMAKSILMILIPELYQRLRVRPPPGKAFKIEMEEGSGFVALPKPFDVLVEKRE